MASFNNDDVITSWKALSGTYEKEGWRSIPIAKLDSYTILAARKFPGNEEAILLGFSSTRIQPTSLLPQSKGFRIERLSLNMSASNVEQQWLALVRQPQGNLGLFSQMVADIINTLASMPDRAGEQLYQQFLLRVKAWQEFMKKSQDKLSPAEELGLVGELQIIEHLFLQDLPKQLVIESWVGPVDGIQDFSLGSGALEVKSTLSKEGFSVQILSLNQLDDSVISPIYLCGCVFMLDSGGRSLPQMVRILREYLEGEQPALELFNNILLRAGYFDSHAKDYTRLFVLEDLSFWVVNEFFPRLVPSNVPMNVRQVRYEIDLTGLDDNLASTEQVLKGLEVI